MCKNAKWCYVRFVAFGWTEYTKNVCIIVWGFGKVSVTFIERKSAGTGHFQGCVPFRVDV